MKQATCHLITSEYPPQMGGVSDYTALVAKGLAAAGGEVHVWCPPALEGSDKDGAAHGVDATVFVHRELGQFRLADLRRAGELLDQFKRPRRLLVQWVPHGYGYRSMNLPFCLWLWNRAVRHRDQVEVMVHEPYLTFGAANWKQNGVAAVHRLMTMVLLRAAHRVWMSIPHWESFLKPYAMGRALPFLWLPVFSTIPVVKDPLRVSALRAGYAPRGGPIVGHFGTYDRHITGLLMETVPALLKARQEACVLFLGRGGEAVRSELSLRHAELAARIYATDALDAEELSLHIGACDLMLQPFIDGVSSRRSSVMVGLAHSRAIVTTRGRLTEDLWTSSESVALAPANDARRLLETALELLADEEGRRRLGQKARALYDARFDARLTINALRENLLSA